MFCLKKTWFQSKSAKTMTSVEQEIAWNLLKAVFSWCLQCNSSTSKLIRMQPIEDLHPFFQAVYILGERIHLDSHGVTFLKDQLGCTFDLD